MPPLKPYQSDLSYSYAPGVFPSMQLMTFCPERASRLLLSAKAQGEGVEKLRELCAQYHVREEYAEKALSRISGKQNCFAAVVFEKWQDELRPDTPHVVLHHPMDEGNLGTIQRTLLGFGIEDLAIITPSADPFDPKVVRATMGAIFAMRVHCYSEFEEYRKAFAHHSMYPFMLQSSCLLEEVLPRIRKPYSLIFGNEGSGLPPEFSQLGHPIRIEHNQKIDSLNLAMAVGIGTYAFVHAKGVEA